MIWIEALRARSVGEELLRSGRRRIDDSALARAGLLDTMLLGRRRDASE